MTVISRYVLSQTLRPMGATILVALLILLAERALRVVNLVIGWRGSLFAIFEMLSYLVPHYMGFALPMALFMGVFLATARISREGELDAIQAAGAGLWRYTRPLVAFTLLLLVLHLFLLGYVQPYSRYAYRAAVRALTNVSFQTLLEPGTFTTLGRTTYLVRALDPAGERFEGLFLYSEAPGGGSIVVTAEAGRIEVDGLAQPAYLRLQNGTQQVLPGAGLAASVERAPSAVTMRFREFTTDLRGGRPIGFRPRGEDERELTLDELFALRNDPPPHIEWFEIAAELDARLARSLSLPFLPLLAVPLALGRRRGRRSYGFIAGVIILVGYNQILQTGEGLADDNLVSTWLGVWLPFAVFAVGTTVLFVRRATHVPDPAKGAFFDRLLERLIEALERRFGAGS